MLKKMTCWILCLVMALSLAACGVQSDGQTPTPPAEQPQEELPELKAGEYMTSTYGHNGILKLKVTTDEHRVVSIEVVESLETPEIAQTAFDQLIPAIIEQQNIALDAVAGATVTSNAILEGVTEAIKTAGGKAEQFTKMPEQDNTPAQTIEKTADVVVIGSGAAGLSAAIEARKAGASVIVLEKLPHIGGNTYISGGYVYGTGSDYQASKGFTEDSPKDLAAYWMERSENTAWEEMLQLVAERSGETIDFLVENGVEFGDPIPCGTSPVLRGLRSPSGGVGLIIPIEKKARELGAEILLNTTAQELLTEGGRVCGVRAVSGRDTVIVRADSVVLATGGYDADGEVMAKYSPDVAGQMSRSSPGNVGDGIRMAMEVGAATALKGGYIGTTSVPGVGYRDPINKRFGNVLACTEEGKRFVNEVVDYPLYHKAMTQSGSKLFFQVFDATLQPEGLENAIQSGVAFTGNTIEELARAAGLPEKALAESVARYNASCAAGVDEEFGKPADKLIPIAEAPFYAVKIAPATIGSIGGVKIDLEARVLDEQGNGIEGLFAAGAVANGEFFYKTYPASGSSICMSFTFGRIAGTNAAANALH